MTVSNLGYRVGLVGGKAANQPHSTHELTKSLSFRVLTFGQMHEAK